MLQTYISALLGVNEVHERNPACSLTFFRESFRFPSFLIPHPNEIKIEADLTLLMSYANYLVTMSVEYSLKDFWEIKCNL